MSWIRDNKGPGVACSYIYHAQFYYNIYNTSLFLASLSLADLLFLLLYVPLDMWRQVDSRVYQVKWILSIIYKYYPLSTNISTRYLDGAGVQDDQLRGDADRPGQRDQPVRSQHGEVSSQQLDNCRYCISTHK